MRIMKSINGLQGTRVPPDIYGSLTKDITKTEIWEIIKASPENKSHGTDGLTNEFYKHFWPNIKNYLIVLWYCACPFLVNHYLDIYLVLHLIEYCLIRCWYDG